MTKNEFLTALRQRLAGLPQEDIEERLIFYAEMIDDRVEEGLSEEDAVKDLGSLEEIVAQIIKETPFTRLAKERIKPTRRLETWELVLLILGAPIWFSLGIAALSVIFSLFVTLFSVIISLWAVLVSFVASALGCVIAGIVFAFTSKPLVGVATVGCGLILASLAIIGFFGCKAASKGAILLGEQATLFFKHLLMKKEDRV